MLSKFKEVKTSQDSGHYLKGVNTLNSMEIKLYQQQKNLRVNVSWKIQKTEKAMTNLLKQQLHH